MVAGTRYPAEILTREEIQRLLSPRYYGRGATGTRNLALVQLLHGTGLRCAEALALRWQDLDPEQGTIRVLRGKGSKARTVGLPSGVWGCLQAWRARRDKIGIGPRVPVFCTLRGRRISTRYVRQLLPRIAARAAIPKRVHPHALRHTFAVEMQREGIPLHVIQHALGHSSAATTSRYLDHLEPREVVDTMRRRSHD